MLERHKKIAEEYLDLTKYNIKKEESEKEKKKLKQNKSNQGKPTKLQSKTSNLEKGDIEQKTKIKQQQIKI